MAENLPLIEVNPLAVAATCPTITVTPCTTCNKTNIGDINVTDGFILEVDATIKNACRGKILSVAVILCETVNRADVVRAVEVIEVTVPAGTGHCVDVPVSVIFALTDVCRDTDRVFKARVIAHYINPAGCTCPCPTA